MSVESSSEMVGVPKSKVVRPTTRTVEDQLAAEMDAVRLSERSCRFVVSPTTASAAADTKSTKSSNKSSHKPSGKMKSRHPTDPLLVSSSSSSTEKKLSLSSSDSHLANKSSSSASPASDVRMSRRKAASVSGSSINIPVAFPSNHSLSAHGNGVLDESPKGATGSSDAEWTPGGSKSSRGQRTPKKEVAKGFESYMMLDQVQQGLKRGELIEGVLRINPKNYQDAYISVPGGRMDICLGGIVDRNRALNGDVVVVKLKPKEEWRILLSDLRNYLLRNNLVAIELLKPKIWSSPKNPLLKATTTTNKRVEECRTIQLENSCCKEEVQAEMTALEPKVAKKQTRRGHRGGKGRKRGGKENENKAIEIVPGEAPLDGSTEVLVLHEDEEEEKAVKKNRRSKRKLKRATTELVAHNDTQVPRPTEAKTSSTPLLICGAKTHSITEEQSQFAIEPMIDDLLMDEEEKNEEPVEVDLIDFSDSLAAEALLSSDELTDVDKGESDDSDVEAVVNVDKERPLDDVYYPGTVSEGVETAAVVDEDKFDWNQLLSEKPLEQLTVEELLRIPSARNFLQPTARVVYIVRRSHNEMARGHLRLLPDKNRNWALFRPVDHRFPLTRVAASNCPSGFFNNPDAFKDTLFVAKLTEWVKPAYAIGCICQSLGTDGDVEAETSALLAESGVDTEEFPTDILDDLPIEFPFQITQAEASGRRDYRSSCVFTIDPETARDLDDAISCDECADGLLRVAVHIADVSHFVVPRSKVDATASHRATSVYLIPQVIPMLPRILCEQLCSLRPSEDRLSFSVEWTIREDDGAILSEWFGKSLIRSCAQLSYNHAQSFIDDENLLQPPQVSSPWSLEELKKRVKTLQTLAVKLRRKRTSRGALRLDQEKMMFHMGSDGLPEDVGSYQLRDSNRLIEELMLLANIAVARRIYKSYPHLAVLRMHPQPVKRALDEVVDMLRPYGILLDPSTSHSLQTSLSNYYGDDEMSFARHQLITHLLTKPMKLAAYFCSGAMSDESQFVHYALSVPLYTHFTSPIRRYPDILVHRLLASALDEVSLPEEPSRICLLQQQLAHCNHAKSTAKTVSDKCNEIYLAAYVRKLGSLETDAIVCGLMDHSFDVLLYRMAIVKRVYCNQINTLDRMELVDEGGGGKKLKLIFADGVVLVITLFTRVRVMLIASEDDGNKIVACLQCVL